MTDPSVSVPTPVLRPSDEPLARRFDVALLDLDGVVYIDRKPVRRAPEALALARQGGMLLRFVTNNAARTATAVAELLQSLGVPVAVDEVVTSAQVAAALLADRLPAGAGVLVVGGRGLHDAVRDRGLVPMISLDEGPVAVVQGFGPDVGWRELAEVSRAVHSGLFWLATNLDLTIPRPFGRAPGNGALVRAVAEAVGHGPDQVAGKPDPVGFRQAAAAAGARRPLVVGDRLDTDLAGARAAELPGLLVLTGVTGARELLTAPVTARPDFLGRDLDALHATHPAVTLSRDGDRIRGTCRQAVVQVGDRIDVLAPGPDALDLLRAGVSATWALVDDRPTTAPAVVPGSAAWLAAMTACEPGAVWAR